MYRLTALRALPRATSSTPATARCFSIVNRTMAGGDTGAPRSGGAAQGDSFTKREQANEDYFVKQAEREKLQKLRQKIEDSEAALAKDKQEAEELAKKQK